ncbi:hypothetical protein D3C75_1099490 [compost metagenome]
MVCVQPDHPARHICVYGGNYSTFTGQSLHCVYPLSGPGQPDRLDVSAVALFWRRSGVAAADADTYAEALRYFTGEYYRLLQSRPGAAERRTVRTGCPGCLCLQPVLRIPHSAYAAGGISSDPALVQA